MTSSKHVTGVSLVASGALEEGVQGRRKARGRGAEKRRGGGVRCCWKGVSLWGQQLGSRLGCKNRPSGLGTARARPWGRTLAGPCPGRELRSGGVCGRPGSQPLTPRKAASQPARPPHASALQRKRLSLDLRNPGNPDFYVESPKVEMMAPVFPTRTRNQILLRAGPSRWPQRRPGAPASAEEDVQTGAMTTFF